MRLLLPSLLVACAAVACSATAEEPMEPVELGSIASPLSAGCAITRDQILASASADRRQAVERGFGWLDEKVPYSQAASHDGYRTDCSGFVSMCWDLGHSSNTSSLYSGDGNTRLDSYDDLVVADALVKQGHVVLFLAWNDDAHEGACVLEQASTASDMQFRVRTTASLRSAGYKAIRADSLTSTEPAGDETQKETVPAPGNSAVTTQSGMAGDPGDPDEDTSAVSDEDDAKPSRKRRATSDLDAGGCAATPHHANSAAWAFPLLVVVGAVLRRRRRS